MLLKRGTAQTDGSLLRKPLRKVKYRCLIISIRDFIFDLLYHRKQHFLAEDTAPVESNCFQKPVPENKKGLSVLFKASSYKFVRYSLEVFSLQPLQVGQRHRSGWTPDTHHCFSFTGAKGRYFNSSRLRGSISDLSSLVGN
jgi:hypothetical protein